MAHLISAHEQSLSMQMGTNTHFDYAVHENAPFCAINGQMLQQYEMYDTLKQGSEFCINHYINLFGLIVRFPDIASMAVVGIIIGITGFIRFRNYNHTKLTLSFLFYAGMNFTGLVDHCLLAMDSEYRVLFTLLEKACTAISGLFLGWILYQLLHKRRSASSLEIFYLFVISLVITLLCVVEVVAVFLYIFVGCVPPWAVSFHILQYQRRSKTVDANLIKIGQCGVAILIATIIVVATSGFVCNATMGWYSSSASFFGLTHIGFIVVYHFVGNFLDKDQKKIN